MNISKILLASLVLLALTIGLHLIPGMDPGVLMASRWATVLAFCAYGWQAGSLTTWILISMLVGFEVGLDMGKAAKDFDVLSTIFIKLIKTVVGPLLFSTLVIGIAGQSSGKQMGRIAVKAFTYFLLATSVALVIGLVAIHLTQAGAGIQRNDSTDKVVVSGAELQAKVDTKKNEAQWMYGDKVVTVKPPDFKLDWKYTVLHTFPENVAKMVYEGAVLQIVIFSLLFALGLRQVSEHHRKTMIHWCEALSEVMFKFVGIIMYFAPFAVGGALASTIGDKGLGVMINLAKLLGTLYLALFVFVVVVFIPVLYFFKIPVRSFLKAVYEPASLAFATASSEAALPQAMTAMEKFGVPRKIVSFVLPTGYSFNLDGSTLYLSLASMFCIQAAGLTEQFTWDKQLILMATLLLTSKGVAAVPRASLVILTATVLQFGIPEWPIAIILGVDALMDMGRTCINLVGNCLASAVVARWEGEFDDEAAAKIQ
ncbi:MAG: dicarboxylate/amino acid:cation symporter [Chitinophagales bacterium]|nr:dicarboxylate/amino acid:cation symporter [Chitinophagales bacterium]